MRDVRKERCVLILQSLEVIDEYLEPIARSEDFLLPKTGSLRLDAITLRLQVIGENAKQIETAFPSFFRHELGYNIGPVIRFRDLASHHYEKLDFEIIYDICPQKLPTLKAVIKSYLNNR